MTLAARTLHPTTGSSSDRIVLLHGFTQNSRCWEPFASLLGQLTGLEIVAVDAPGHGASPPEHDTADLWQSASLIGEVGGPAHYVGYSMGGRTAIHLSLARPELITSLTLIGSTPGIASEAERADRRRADALLAGRLLRIGVDAFVDEWLSQPLFSGLTDIAAHRHERLRNRPAGLADSLIRCGTGTQEDLRSRLSEIRSPVLCVVGSKDHKFQALARELPGSKAVISNSGHSAHLEQPQDTATAIAHFILSNSDLNAG